MARGDRLAPTLREPLRGAAIRDRFCQKEVWYDGEHEPARFVICGGELRHARRVEGECIVTYLMCLFCRALIPTMVYDMRTGEHRSVEKEDNDERTAR